MWCSTGSKAGCSPGVRRTGTDGSAVEPRHRADRCAGAALDLDREADEAETPLADQLVEIDQPLHVGEAHVAADVVHLEIVAPCSARAHRLDAEHADALVAEPSCGLLG